MKANKPLGITAAHGYFLKAPCLDNLAQRADAREVFALLLLLSPLP